MLGEGRVYMRTPQWLATFPHIAISLLTRGISRLGNGPRYPASALCRRVEPQQGGASQLPPTLDFWREPISIITALPSSGTDGLRRPWPSGEGWIGNWEIVGEWGRSGSWGDMRTRA